jgi:hypothetical protein
MVTDTMLTELSPIVSQYNMGMFRVPLHRVDNSYRIFVADKFTRVYDEDTLPDEVKTKMAMILASDYQAVSNDVDLSMLSIYQTPDNEAMREIGWRASETYFVVILTAETLMHMRGE